MERKTDIPATVNQAGTGEGRYKSYVPLLDKRGILFAVRKPWLLVGEVSYTDGWILCLPLTIKYAEEILDTVLPVLIRFDVSFRLIADQLQHNRINNHAFPVQLFGKPLMIFPKDERQAIRLAGALSSLTGQYSGMVLPDCLRLGSIVYAAYCSVRPPEEDSGPDLLPFVLSIPKDGLSVPFPSEMQYKTSNVKRFIKRRYLPLRLISSTHKGNILKAVDIFRLRWCFVKQARAWAGEDLHGRQMRDRLVWQKYVSEKLDSVVLVPKMYDFVEQDGYAYLITQFIDGRSLDELIKSGSTDFARLLRCYLKALVQLREMHWAGYLHRDLTAKNILLANGGEVFLTDLELAYPKDEDKGVPFDSGTIGYMSPQQASGANPTIADDVFSCGALLYYLVSRNHPRELVSLSDQERNDHIDNLQISPNIRDAIDLSMAKNANERCRLTELIDRSIRELAAGKTVAPKMNPIGKLPTKKKIAISVLMVILAFLTVFVLWKTSDEPNSRNNGFVRAFISNELEPITEIPLPGGITSIAGLIGDSLYFSTVIGGQIAVLDTRTGHLGRRMFLRDSTEISNLSNATILQVDRWGLTLFDGSQKLIFTRSWNNKKIHTKLVADPFTRAVKFSSRSIAMRKFKTGERDQYFARYDLKESAAFDDNLVVESIGDAGLVTGGFLDCGPNGHCIYITRYANHIYSLDSNMNMEKRGTTIDTFSRYTLESRTVLGRRNGLITNGGPTNVVNQTMVMADGRIYVHSLVKADNETLSQFLNTDVIDVYRVDDLRYLGSMRIATENKQHIRKLRIDQGKLYLLYADMLRIYTLPEIGTSGRKIDGNE